MIVSRLPSGKWAVIDETGNVLSEHPSNSAAWRALDRLENQPTSKREETADWAWRQGLDR